MKISPPPRFLMVHAVELSEIKHGELVVVMTPHQAMGRVLANNSERLKEVKVGQIVFYAAQNLNIVGIEDDHIEGAVYEDAVVGIADEADFPVPLKSVSFAAHAKMQEVAQKSAMLAAMSAQGLNMQHPKRN